MPKYPEMTHLEGFWDRENWTDAKWDRYKEKKLNSFRKRCADRFDQFAHRLMGKFRGREWWEARERGQWPSSTGSYDPCADHYNWLLGRHPCEAGALKKEAQKRRPEFLT